MKRSRNTPILFVGLLALISYVSASRLPVHGQATASQDVGNIHVMFAEGDTLSSDSPPRFDTQGAARQFYQNHGDDYDILVYFTNFQTADDADGFFYETLRNSTTGIGVELMDPSDALANYGSASRLQGSVFQGRLSIYPDDDLDAPLMDGSSPGQTVTSNTLLGQEVMHRFNAFVRFDSDPGPGITPSRDMLGREQAHWSFYLESQASVFDGLQWRADSSTNFTAIDSFRRFSQLDLYLMGAKTASEVEPWFLIDDPVPVFSDTAQSVTTSGEYPVVVVLRNFGPEGSLIDDVLVSNPGTSREQQFSVVSSGQDVTDSSLGQIEIGVKGTGQPPTDIDFKAGDPFLVKYDATGPVRHKIGNSDSEGNVQFLTGATIIVNGTKKDITIDDVIAVEGPRVPDAQNGASVRAAFILLQLPGTSINQTEVTKLDNIRKGFTTWFNDQTGSRLTIDTSLAQTGVTSFTLPDSGGFSATTSATASDVSSGYARILPGSGSSAPAGLAIFGFTAGGVLVSEAGVPASPLIQSGRIYAEVAGAVNTGLAIANPSSLVATVTFRFTDATGTDFGSGTTTIAAGGQIAKFLNQDPFNSGDNVNGTFTFSSDVPISVIALRGFTNERAEFLITTLPVATLSTTSTATGLFPHFADGGGWTTQVILVNPTDGVLAGNVQFFSQGDDTTSGAPATVTVDGVAATSFAYSIPARSSRRFPTSGTPTSTTSGSVRIVPAAGQHHAVRPGRVYFQTGRVHSCRSGRAAASARHGRAYVRRVGLADPDRRRGREPVFGSGHGDLRVDHPGRGIDGADRDRYDSRRRPDREVSGPDRGFRELDHAFPGCAADLDILDIGSLYRGIEKPHQSARRFLDHNDFAGRRERCHLDGRAAVPALRRRRRLVDPVHPVRGLGSLDGRGAAVPVSDGTVD